MAITGVGIDIEDISRFRETAFETNKPFYEKIFTEDEIAYCLSRTDPYPHFAARFCAKEAFVKAATAVNAQQSCHKIMINYKSVQVLMEKTKPFLEYQKQRHLLSLSHDKDKAVAVVILQ